MFLLFVATSLLDSADPDVGSLRRPSFNLKLVQHNLRQPTFTRFSSDISYLTTRVKTRELARKVLHEVGSKLESRKGA